jgi:hypothetical protein
LFLILTRSDSLSRKTGNTCIIIRIQHFICFKSDSTSCTIFATDSYEAASRHCARAVDTSDLGTDADDDNGAASLQGGRTARAPQRYSDSEFQPESAVLRKLLSPGIRPQLSAVRENIAPPPVPQQLSAFRVQTTCETTFNALNFMNSAV